MAEVRAPYVEIPFEAGRGSKHATIVEQLRARITLSEQAMQNRRVDYADLEDRFMAYAPEREVDALRKGKRRLEGVPDYTTVIIPYTYAEVMTMHTYYATVLLGRRPVYQYNGRHGEPQRQKLAVEALMEFQLTSGRNMVPLYVWLLDALKYGRGIIWTQWEERYSYFTEYESRDIAVPGLDISLPRKPREVQKRVLQYMGNRFFNVRNQDFLPDPRVPTAYLQDGEFVGRRFKLFWTDLLKMEAQGEVFNIEPAKRRLKEVRQDRREGSIATDLPEDQTQASLSTDKMTSGFLDCVELIIEIVPREWQLAGSDMPQKWVFLVANKDLIISARPYGAYHDRFPAFTLEPEFDGYALHSRSPQEVISSMEEVMTWLFNSHFYNVRAALNNMMVFDPSRVEIEDVLDPLPGNMIRLSPMAYGSDPSSALKQLQVQDVTRSHIPDTRYVLDILQRVDGLNDNLFGTLEQGGRRTATEVRQSNTFGVSRMKVKTEFLEAQGWSLLAEVALQNTQQYYTLEERMRIVGDLSAGMDPFVDVTPEAIAGSFDFVHVDGNVPLDKFALANLWRQIFADIARIPQMHQELDIPGIFYHVAKLAGATDIEQFRLRPQMMPNEQIQKQVQAGNLVPMNGGSPPNVPIEGDERAASRVPPTGQIAGMGTIQ